MLVFQETIEDDRRTARVTGLFRNALQVHRNSRSRLWRVGCCQDVKASGQDVPLRLRSLLPEIRLAQSA